MKIAFFHELHSGGARKAANEFAKELKKKHRVDLFIVDKKENQEEKKFFSHIYVSIFNAKKWSGGNWKTKLYKDTLELFKLYKLHKEIANTIDKKNYDFVFVHPSQFTQTPFLLRFLKRKKIYYCEEPLRFVYEPAFKVDSKISSVKKAYENINRLVRKIIDRSNISHADLILANSKHTQKNIFSAYNKTGIVSYLAVDPLLFHPQKIKKDIDVLYIGAKDEVDGYFLFQKALTFMKKKPKVTFHIFGENWIENEKDFAALYARSKVVVCLARNEPFGLIALEAMACGIPVIALAEGGYKETVEDQQTGYFVPYSAKILSQRLEGLLNNETLRITMGENARKHILKEWTWKKRTKELELIFQKFTNEYS